MEKLAKQLAFKIASSLNYDKEKEAVIAYGLIAIIQVTITVLLILLFGILINAPVEALIICFSASLLRKYSGGAHAETPELCTMISVLYCTLTALLAKYLLVAIYRPIPMAIAILLIFALSFLVIYQLAPVDSPNKPIRTEKKKKRMRKGSFLILFVYFILSLIFWVFSNSFAAFKAYAVCILLGISWQTLTLTSVGFLFIGKINHLLIHRKEGL
ncbi:MAG: accessory gene regulator B family protein [Clostridia bacterium]|nr:accessory gene regulator B family protein [Clostridia bacterium]